jgi:hypothetical protein
MIFQVWYCAEGVRRGRRETRSMAHLDKVALVPLISRRDQPVHLAADADLCTCLLLLPRIGTAETAHLRTRQLCQSVQRGATHLLVVLERHVPFRQPRLALAILDQDEALRIV